MSRKLNKRQHKKIMVNAVVKVAKKSLHIPYKPFTRAEKRLILNETDRVCDMVIYVVDNTLGAKQ